jgi:hypothetical protein
MHSTTALLGLLLGASSVLSRAAAAQANPVDSAKVPSLAAVEVQTVRLVEGRKPAQTPVRAGIGDRIELKVANLGDLIRNARCLNYKDDRVASCEPHSIVLYLDGREMAGIHPESGAPLPDQGRLQFHLERSTDSLNNETWADLLGAPGLKGNDFYFRPAEVSVGLEDGYPVPTMVLRDDFELIRLHKDWFIGCLIAFGLILIALFALAMRTGLLRDIGPAPPEGKTKGWFLMKPVRKPYSLGRVQMAYWFVLVIASFLFIWLVTGSYDTITASVLGLIGIGAGTWLGAAVIETGKNQTDEDELKRKKAELTGLEREVAELEARVPGATAGEIPALVAARTLKQARLAEFKERITELEASSKPQESRGFGMDLLTDQVDGVGFHRFQMVAWTLVLGILFVRSVWERLAMPEFSATLLALLGISAGTYLGFKIPEGKGR